MKKIIVWALCFLPLAGIVSCADMLDTQTDHYLDSDDLHLDSPNDTIYSMVGILRKMQALADRYVLVGELRGDLMDITPNADLHLQAISNFDFGDTVRNAQNPWLSSRPFYDVINHCNLFIQRTDTLHSAPKDVMFRELAAVKAIRAWVYMQLVLNYGQAVYYTNPILTVEDMNKIKNEPGARITELSDLLTLVESDLQDAEIKQLSLGYPNYEGVLGIEAAFIPATLVLADLDLYTGKYLEAAIRYNQYLTRFALRSNLRQVEWSNAAFNNASWTAGTDERIATILTTSENGASSQLLNYCYPEEWGSRFGIQSTYQLQPSAASRETWNKQVYAYTPRNETRPDSIIYTTGDLRGKMGRSYSGDNVPSMTELITDSYVYFTAAGSDSLPVITKYAVASNSNIVNLYRVGLVYLRFAEAINRMNKPSLAFAVLRYGAMDAVLKDKTKVNPTEQDGASSFWKFPTLSFPNLNASGKRSQIGIHSRGSGFSDNNKFYDFPVTCANAVDSMRFVDEMLCDEMAMETAFEGNRFQDLMRFDKFYSETYADTYPEGKFLADRVAVRRGTKDNALYSKLLNKQNWYLPQD